jgi:hypothetical protein
MANVVGWLCAMIARWEATLREATVFIHLKATDVR